MAAFEMLLPGYKSAALLHNAVLLSFGSDVSDWNSDLKVIYRHIRTSAKVALQNKVDNHFTILILVDSDTDKSYGHDKHSYIFMFAFSLSL